MKIIEIAEFMPVRMVHRERQDRNGYAVDEYEIRTIELCQYDSEYYLLYWHDPLPGGCGDVRCEGIVHIDDPDMDDRQLVNLYYKTKKKHLIDIGLLQDRMTLTYLSASYCADSTCIVWCASRDHEERSAGCIEFTKDEMITEKKLKSVLHKAVPGETVIPAFSLYRE